MHERLCPDCKPFEAEADGVNRRQFVQSVGAAAAIAAMPSISSGGQKKTPEAGSPEALVSQLYGTLTTQQKDEICFPWDHKDDRGLLRTRVENNWSITDRRTQNVGGSFYTKDQQEIIESIFFGLYNSEWHDRLRKQLKDDAGGYGKAQTIAIFGEPGSEKFEFVMTGRHLTIRCDGNSAEHVAFGGPIFYGHAAQAFNETADHPGNVYWHQALKANALYQMLDGKQRKQALLPKEPHEADVAFRGDGKIPGLAGGDLSSDQRTHLKETLNLLLEPYRQADREESLRCLEKHGGLDACSLSFYQSGDIGQDGVWDVWRLEGPAFVWHWRGSPHVHVWVNIADDPGVMLNARG